MGLRDDETTDYGPLTTDYKTTDHGPQDYQGKAETLTRRNAANKSPYVFRKVGRHWQVVCGGGRMFRLRNTLGARYLEICVSPGRQASGNRKVFLPTIRVTTVMKTNQASTDRSHPDGCRYALPRTRECTQSHPFRQFPVAPVQSL